MLVFGILNHELPRDDTKNNNIIHIIDKSLAHFAFLYTLIDSYNILFMNISLANIFFIYGLELLFPKYNEKLHVLIHLQTVISMNVYLYYNFQEMSLVCVV
jgi:hypothetical protein